MSHKSWRAPEGDCPYQIFHLHETVRNFTILGISTYVNRTHKNLTSTDSLSVFFQR